MQSPGGTPFTGIADTTTWNFSTPPGDPLSYSARLKDHINGIINLTAAEIEQYKLDLDSVAPRFPESAATITALLDLVTAYDTSTNATRKGPLWVARSLPKRDAVINDLPWTMFNVMQNIMDRIYTRETVAAHEALLGGFKFGSSANFPGPCAPPANPGNTHTATLSASYPNTFGRKTLADGPFTFARKPTGTYLAPGTIVTVTVPPSMVGTGYRIRVGCHSPDFGAKPDIKRLDRVTRTFDITALQTKVANPLGGGIYLEVPWLANAGVVTVDITGAVRSPYFSAKSFHTTTPAEWLVERSHPGPWADFQSEKFMMQVPKTWISAMPDPTQLMADWDAAMDAMHDLLGYPRIRGKESLYPQVDLLLKNSVYAPGYPSVNTTYSPTGNYNGYASSHLVRGPVNAPYYEFHELGHGYLFPKFGGESESTVNLLHVAVVNRKFGKSLDEGLRKSMGGNNPYQTLDTTAMAWMCVFNFSPREVPMDTAEKAYQLKGHAKFVDIAGIYGWEVLDDFWRGMQVDDENNTSYSTSDDSLMLRLCRSVGFDIRPLFHFWGIHPQNPAASGRLHRGRQSGPGPEDPDPSCSIINPSCPPTTPPSGPSPRDGGANNPA